MRCPHCDTGVSLEMDETTTWKSDTFDQDASGYHIAYAHCPECIHLIAVLRKGPYKEIKNTTSDYKYGSITDVSVEEVIYPKHISRKVEQEVPERHRQDFVEACSVLPISPKASAALSRRILQDVLRSHFSIQHTDLAREIEEFINLKDVPSYLAEAVDAVRNIGNFAAHPLKNTNTGEIVDVEPGEADWLLDVIEALFDFVFVQPIKLQEKTRSLNNKLQALGKPAMKLPKIKSTT